jgi:hypothetical protein
MLPSYGRGFVTLPMLYLFVAGFAGGGKWTLFRFMFGLVRVDLEKHEKQLALLAPPTSVLPRWRGRRLKA